MSADFLQAMARSSRERASAARALLSEEALLARAWAAPPPPPLILSSGSFDLIAELKLRSPALGRLEAAAGDDVARRVAAYAAGGAAAVSVLTEPSRFDGALEHLGQATAALRAARVPAMRKDFLVDPYQVLEARAAGAGGVLLILRMLSRAQLRELCACAQACGLFILLEAFDEADIALAHEEVEAHSRAQPASAPPGARRRRGTSAPVQLLVGVNCRDLGTLAVVPGRLEQLLPLLPGQVPRVAESGVSCAADARRVAAAGYDLALVGSALMSGADPRALTREMVIAGRQARQQWY